MSNKLTHNNLCGTTLPLLPKKEGERETSRVLPLLIISR